MSAKANDFKLGLFVLAGVGILVAAIFIFGASKWFEGKTVEETYVASNVDGLKTGAPVTLRGVPVGQVTRINFTWNIYHHTEPRYVYVEFEVNNDVALVPPGPRFAKQIQDQVNIGLRARVKSQGLAGATILSLEYVNPSQYPPLRVPWKPRNIYIPSAPSQFSEILASLDKTLGKIKQIDFAKIAGAVQQDLAAGQRLLNHIDQANIAGVVTNANQLLANLQGISGQIHTFIGATNSAPQVTLKNVSSNADRVLVELHTTVDKLNRIVAGIDASPLSDTLDNLRRASEDLEQAIERFKQYPAGVVFGKPPPPARSVEPPGK
ncbi:MAG TPA: MlaD family protein [Verrucomicrobiae bacterium]|nr:MlaD family protein [Verrucomicrobiae bacterium]